MVERVHRPFAVSSVLPVVFGEPLPSAGVVVVHQAPGLGWPAASTDEDYHVID